MDKKTFITGVTTGILLSVVALKISPFTLVKSANFSFTLPRLPFMGQPTPTPESTSQVVATNEVLPDQYNLGISFGDAIVKLVRSGAIDKNKFVNLYEGRNALSEDQKKLLDEPSNTQIIVTQENAGLLLNLLWPLGIANKTNVLSQGPMGTQYKNEVGNFASTGGWSLGKEEGGKLFNRFSIVSLSADQEALVTEIAQNIYRPCCGNSTYFPDCNHGAAMLGFIELAVAQGMPKDEIYQKALVLNSYWFPQTYVELATYFKAKKNIAWNNVNPQEALGANYSSGQGYSAVNKELQADGILPKVKGGGSCGV